MPAQSAAAVMNKPPADQLGVLAEIADRHQLVDLSQRCRTAWHQTGDAPLTVAVLGRFKAGKSTLLNQLLAADLLPVQAIPATAVITRLRYAPSLAATVHPLAGGAFPIELDALADWVTEAGNPGNREQVEWVEVGSPALSDLRELVLADTPGTGSTWLHNTETSLDWLPNVGAALIAVNATQPLAEEDLRLIRSVAPHTPNLIVVLTKIDLLSESDLAAVIAHVRAQLRVHLHVEPPILAVSIAARHRIQREQLRGLLVDLSRDHRRASLELAEHRAGQLRDEIAGYLELARSAASGHADAVSTLRAALAAEAERLPLLRGQARAQLAPVNRSIIGFTQARVKDSLAKMVYLVHRDLAAELPSWRGSLSAESARFRGWLRQELATQLTPFAEASYSGLSGLLADGLAPAERIGEAFQQRLGALVRSATGTVIDLPIPAPVAGPVEPVDVLVNAIFDSHLELLSWAIPMPLVRSTVHRHFLAMVPWQVEKNLTRTAFSIAASARRSIERSLDGYLAGLAGVLELCRQLVDRQPADLPALEADLARVAALPSREYN